MDEASAPAEQPTRLRLPLHGVAEACLDGQPRWTHAPIAQAQLLSPGLEMPRYCESLRCQGKRRTATTFHALINVPGEPDCAWVACADCTGLMMEEAYAG
jgi:hypothetical protein